MKLAAIADIHGNALALEVVLADIAAQGIGDVVNLGDHVSGPLEAARTANMLMARRNIVSIQGDQDRRLVEAAARGSKRMDLAQLRPEHIDWLAQQPPTLLYRDEVSLCHGSPRDDACYWLDRVTPAGGIEATPVADIEREAEGISASLILCAHTHIPRVVRLRDGRTIVNPGSVGCPGYLGVKPVPHIVSTGTPDACYAILEKASRGWTVTFRYVRYDHLAMAEMARKNGMPDWASALATGCVR